jgi:hypothetical protein
MSRDGCPGQGTAVSNVETEVLLTEADVDPARMDDFASHLAELRGPKTTVEAEVFWRLFIAAFPHRPRGDESRRVLLRALLHAEEKGVIRIPSRHGKLWERAFYPPLPRRVYRVSDRPAADQSWREYPWGKDLQWVRRLPSLTPAELSLLKRIHEGIRDGIFADPVPLPDEHPPIAWYAIGSEPSVLVVENKTAFSVIRGVLRSVPESPYGMVAYGGGIAFMQSVLELGQIGRPVQVIHYIGDLDRPGLFIARTAAITAKRAGLPDVLPAPYLHGLMLDSTARMGYPNGMEYKEESGPILEKDEELLDWLPEDVRAGVANILSLGRRVPEEILLPRDLRALWTGSRY